jgi:hypothetical protein
MASPSFGTDAQLREALYNVEVRVWLELELVRFGIRVRSIVRVRNRVRVGVRVKVRARAKVIVRVSS